MQNVVVPTLVAVATKFGLGVESQLPIGLFSHVYLCIVLCIIDISTPAFLVFFYIRAWLHHAHTVVREL